MKSIRILLVIVIVQFLPTQVFAQEVKDLYSARIVVPSQSEAQRLKVLPQALEQVLIKVSGNTDIGQVDKIQEVLHHPENYLDNYTYETPHDKLLLLAQFNPEQLKSLLRHTGQTVWGDDRPLTMVWLVVDDGEQKEFVGSDSQTDVIKEMTQLGQSRGLPIMFPLLDLQDMGQVSVNDVLAPFPWKIHQASKRYASDVELIGRISRVEDVSRDKLIWQGQWLLVQNGAKLNWQTKGDDIQQVTEQVVNEVADALGSQYAVSYHGGKNQQLSLVVYGINDIAAYTKASSYLKGLSLVAQLEVSSIADDHVVYHLVVAGGAHHLAKVLNDDKSLVPLDQGEIGSEQAATLSYRLAS